MEIDINIVIKSNEYMVKDMDKDKVKEAKINFFWDGIEIVELWNKWKNYKFDHFKFKYKTIITLCFYSTQQ